ncbi:hypothetical protein L6164_023320 [Bauhinia variegata]|uniref:Uncharacterized protein n=1 Tax=Bauhinia variegata TaxID=167791 RepID=A0ACB9MIA9_BAUVA|nr:hypothetical protein L6164_023320 [Bauhinia variegata]
MSSNPLVGEPMAHRLMISTCWLFRRRLHLSLSELHQPLASVECRIRTPHCSAQQLVFLIKKSSFGELGRIQEKRTRRELKGQGI